MLSLLSLVAIVKWALKSQIRLKEEKIQCLAEVKAMAALQINSLSTSEIINKVILDQ